VKRSEPPGRTLIRRDKGRCSLAPTVVAGVMRPRSASSRAMISLTVDGIVTVG
jgi:hypothetical protein